MNDSILSGFISQIVMFSTAQLFPHIHFFLGMAYADMFDHTYFEALLDYEIFFTKTVRFKWVV